MWGNRYFGRYWGDRYWSNGGAGAPPVVVVAPTLRDAYGAGRERGRDWRALGDAEYLIHSVDYRRRLEKAVESAPKLRRQPDELPDWLEDFLEEEEPEVHLAALDLLLSKIDRNLQQLVKAWLEKQLADDDEDVVMLLLN